MEIDKVFGEKISTDELLQKNPLVLAFVGDGIHTAFVRTHLVEQKGSNIGDYHKQQTYYCKASCQSKVMDNILEKLDEKELQIVKRARNCKSHNIAKNSSLVDYKKATSFEALVGFLYLNGNYERMTQILFWSMEEKNDS